MVSVPRLASESPEDFVRRYYCVRGTDGLEKSARIATAVEALSAANPDFDQRKTVQAPEIPGIPPLRVLVDDLRALPEVVREYLPRIEADPGYDILRFSQFFSDHVEAKCTAGENELVLLLVPE